MYTTYTTDAFILHKHASGEADMIVVVYTKDFGLIHARATGVRLQKSKLKSSLQTLMRVRVSLVRGVREWRITGAEEGVSCTISNSVAARIALLLTRLIRGAERNESLFDFLDEHMYTTCEMRDELFYVAGVLFFLGYIEVVRMADETLSLALQREIATRKSALLQKVNEALHNSHL